METQIGVIKYDENKKPYQVLFTVKGDQTGQTYEVYQKFYGDFGVFLREKGPEAGASITKAASRKASENALKEKSVEGTKPAAKAKPAAESKSAAEKKPEAETKPAAKTGADEPAETISTTDMMLAFLDEKSFHKKEMILDLIEEKGEITDLLIDNLAAALDVVIEDGPISTRFEQLQSCVRTRSRFENNRLR